MDTTTKLNIMDQSTAKKLFVKGAFFVFLNVPEGTEFGIDMKSWNTGGKFRGVKMIPPGLHYIFYSSVSDDGETAPRTGFFHRFRESEFLVRKWDRQAEALCTAEISQTEIVGLKDRVLMLDEFLGPYPYDIWEKWKDLTSHITDELLERLNPLSGQVRSALELQSCPDADRPRGTKRQAGEEVTLQRSLRKSQFFTNFENNLLPNLKPLAGTALRLTEFPEKHYPEGSTAAEITKHSMDSTYLLSEMIVKYKDPTDILGEIEYCFVCFMIGHSLEAFEQWKKLISLLCSCDIAIKKYRKIYDLLINILEIQINEVPEEFLADIVLNKNFIYVKLRDLFRSIQSSSIDGQLKSKVERFKKRLTEKYEWDFRHLDSEDEEDAPVIVETS